MHRNKYREAAKTRQSNVAQMKEQIKKKEKEKQIKKTQT